MEEIIIEIELPNFELPNFELPSVDDNDSGWGPGNFFEEMDGIPFAPFNKNDRLGRISDWTQPGQTNRRGRGGLAHEYHFCCCI